MSITIETPIGTRERCSIGETSVPTFYGSLKRGDKKVLAEAGYPIREVRKASGIRTNGNLVVWAGQCYYEVGAPQK